MAAHQSSDVLGAWRGGADSDVLAHGSPDQAAALALVDLGTTTRGTSSWYELHGKRMFDVVAAALLLLFVLPLLLLLMILLRVSLGRGIFFTQERVGRGGETFRMLKFRTMEHDRRSGDIIISFADRRQTHKSTNDPRHTPVGRFLRRTSLDELPQLLNVLKGDMSLVGPRPELVSVAHRYGIFQHPRHRVRPGITGAWQISSLRSSADLQGGLAIDAEYVANVNPLRDGAILVKTLGAVVRSTGS